MIYGAAVTLNFRRKKRCLDHKELRSQTFYRLSGGGCNYPKNASVSAAAAFNVDLIVPQQHLVIQQKDQSNNKSGPFLIKGLNIIYCCVSTFNLKFV